MIYIYRPVDILELKHEAEWIYIARKWGMHYGNERVWAMFLNVNYELLEFIMSNRSNNKNNVYVDVEGILERGSNIGARYMILFHSHPESNKPSKEDYKLTQQLKYRAEEFNMKLIESIIEGNTYQPYCCIKDGPADMLEYMDKRGFSLKEKFSIYANGIPKKQIICGLDYAEGQLSPQRIITNKIYKQEDLFYKFINHMIENYYLPLRDNYGLKKLEITRWRRKEKATNKPFSFSPDAMFIPSIVNIKLKSAKKRQEEYE